MALIEESLEVFATLAERRYVRVLVEPTQACSAQVSMEARAHVVVLAGRSLGGLLFGVAQALPFLADFLSFVVSVASLACIGRGQERSTSPARAARSNLWGEVRDGSHELFTDVFARSATLVSASMTLISQALIIVFLVAAHSSHVSSLVIGCVLAASGVGGLLGALISQRFLRPENLSPLRLQPIIWIGMLIAIAMSGRYQVPVMVVVMVVFGLAGAMGNVKLDTYLIAKVPDKKLARVTSIELLLDFAAGAIGPALGGLLTELCGTCGAIWTLVGLTGGITVLETVTTAIGMRARILELG
jgi:hypothetical protein